jgi:hypothetical protein
MVVTVADVVTQLQGVEFDPPAPITEYYFFGHRTTVAAIQQWIDDMTAFHNQYWEAGTLTAQAALIDLLVRWDVCFNIMGVPVMGTLMLSGFSYKTLELDIKKGSEYTDMVKNVSLRLYGQYSRLRAMLQDGAEVDIATDMGEDFWQDGLDLFDADTIPTF